MALNGRAGQRFSHAPQPMQRCLFIVGILRERGLFSSIGTMVMALDGQ